MRKRSVEMRGCLSPQSSRPAPALSLVVTVQKKTGYFYAEDAKDTEKRRANSYDEKLPCESLRSLRPLR